MKNPYLEENRGSLTASKLKAFIIGPEVFRVQYIDEVPNPKESDSRALVLGTAVDDWISYGKETFDKKYFVKRKILKSDYINILLTTTDFEESELKKMTVPTLEELYFGDLSKKIELTEAEYKVVRGCVLELERQPLFDKDGGYKCQQTYIGKYKGLKLKGTLDRDKDGIIRDTKTTKSLKSFEREWSYANSFDGDKSLGYDISMAFYRLLKYLATGQECELILDVVEKTYPYNSAFYKIPKESILNTIETVIKPNLDKLDALMTVWNETKDPKIWEVKHKPDDNLALSDYYPILETAKIKQELYLQ